MKRIWKTLLLIGITTSLFTGCGFKKIIQEKGSEYKLTELKDTQLEEGKYYVKDSTTFYEVHETEKNNYAASSTKKVDTKRLLWTTLDDSLIPSMYEDGLIAYKTKDSVLEDINIERFKDIGWSIGVQGAEIDADGYVLISFTSDSVKDSDFYNQLLDYKNYDIRIVSINGEPIKDSFDGISGTITGLERNKTYTMELYVGSQYMTLDITADIHYYQSFEMYYVESSIDTKNGYLAIEMPDGINSGFYNINGAGLFKYYNTPKGQTDVSQDMNVVYYENEADAITANSQAYVVGIEQLTESVEFTVEYATDIYTDDDIIIYLTSPDGTSYQMVPIAGYAITDIENAIAGRWTINIMPKDLEIINVTAEALDVFEDAIKENYTLELEEGTNVKITCAIEGEGDVWGTISDESGNAYEFTQNEGAVTTIINYVSGGTYQVNIYHYADTNISEPEVSTDEDAESTDVIVVESD